MRKKRRVNWTAVASVCVGLGFLFVLGAGLFVAYADSPRGSRWFGEDPVVTRAKRVAESVEAADTARAPRASAGAVTPNRTTVPAGRGADSPPNAAIEDPSLQQPTVGQSPGDEVARDFEVVPVVVPPEQAAVAPTSSVAIAIAVLPATPGTAATGAVPAAGTAAVGTAAPAVGGTATAPATGATGATPTATAPTGAIAPGAGAGEPAIVEPSIEAAVDDEADAPIAGADMGYTYCGTTTCNVGFKCCCSVCTPFEEECNPTACAAWTGLSVSVPCGMDICDPGEVCCDPRCGACATAGECPAEPCD